VKRQQTVGREAAPRFLETTTALEKKFLEGRQNRAEELESAVRYFLEFLEGFESLDITDSPDEVVAILAGTETDRSDQHEVRALDE